MEAVAAAAAAATLLLVEEVRLARSRRACGPGERRAARSEDAGALEQDERLKLAKALLREGAGERWIERLALGSEEEWANSMKEPGALGEALLDCTHTHLSAAGANGGHHERMGTVHLDRGAAGTSPEWASSVILHSLVPQGRHLR